MLITLHILPCCASSLLVLFGRTSFDWFPVGPLFSAVYMSFRRGQQCCWMFCQSQHSFWNEIKVQNKKAIYIFEGKSLPWWTVITQLTVVEQVQVWTAGSVPSEAQSLPFINFFSFSFWLHLQKKGRLTNEITVWLLKKDNRMSFQNKYHSLWRMNPAQIISHCFGILWSLHKKENQIS